MAEDMDLLLSLYTGLGRYETTEDGSALYKKDDDCLACLKDLQRLLRRDDPQHREVFFKLGELGIAQYHLVPLIVTYPDDEPTVFNSLKVLTFLTMPLPAKFEDTEDPLQQMLHMQAAKAAFLRPDCVAVVVGLVAGPLSRHPRMTTNDHLTVQLVLTFFRNLLQIADPTNNRGSSAGNHKTDMQAKLLLSLFDLDVMELLLTVAQRMQQRPLREDAALMLEILCAVFDGVDPGSMLTAVVPAQHEHRDRRPAAAEQQPAAEKQRAAEDAQRLKERQAREKQASAMRVKNSRAALLGSHFAVRSAVAAPPPAHAAMRTTGGASGGAAACNVSVGRNAQGPCHFLGASFKAQTTLPKLAAAVASRQEESHALMGPLLLVRLREYAEQLLGGAYSILMETLRRELEPGLGISRLGRDDFVRFMRLTTFFTAYVHAKHESGKSAGPLPDGSQPSPFAGISATMGWETFQLTRQLWLSQLHMKKDKDRDWVLQHVSTGLMKELLEVLVMAERSGSAADRRAADRLQRRLLHEDDKESGMLPVLAKLVKEYDHKWSPKSHAAHLALSVYAVLKMYDRLAATESGGFLVRVKKRAGGGRRKQAPAQPDGQEGVEGAEGDTAEAGAGGDAADAGAGGSAEGVQAAEGGGQRHDPFEEMEQSSEDEEPRTVEVPLDLNTRFVKEMVQPSVVQLHVWLMQNYSKNGPKLNHAVCSFLWRIILPNHVNLEPMLYKLSVLRVMHVILSDRSIRGKEEHKEMLTLCTRVVRGLFARLVPPLAFPPAPDAAKAATQSSTGADGNGEGEVGSAAATQAETEEAKIQHAQSSMMFVELMFWSNKSVLEQIREGYFLQGGSEELPAEPSRGGNSTTAIRDMSDDEGGEGRREDAHDAPAPARRRETVAERQRRLMEQHHHARSKGTRGSKGGRKAPPLDAELARKLRSLFEQHCGAKKKRAAMEAIAEEFGRGTTSYDVAHHLKELGLRFGELTSGQVSTLGELFERFGPGGLTQIAAELPGGFSARKIKKLLVRHGLMEADASADSSADEEGERELSPEQLTSLRALYEANKDEEDYLDRIAESLQQDLDLDLEAGELLALIRRHVLKLKKKGRKDRGSGPAVPVKLLKELYARYKNETECLNLIAEQLPGGFSVNQVQQLLARHRITDESKKRSRGMVAREVVEPLYLMHRASPDHLDLIAHDLAPHGTFSARQVARLLRKHGLVASKKKKRSGGTRQAQERTIVGSGPSSGPVQEPDAAMVLGYLEAVSKDSMGSWMSPAQMVAWLTGKLAAAEKLWAGRPGPHTDFALVPQGDEDFNFFCTDYSNELLTAAGVRHGEDDYFKLPGNCPSGWLGRVRETLRAALEKLGTLEAAEALQEVRQASANSHAAGAATAKPPAPAAARAAAAPAPPAPRPAPTPGADPAAGAPPSASSDGDGSSGEASSSDASEGADDDAPGAAAKRRSKPAPPRRRQAAAQSDGGSDDGSDSARSGSSGGDGADSAQSSDGGSGAGAASRSEEEGDQAPKPRRAAKTLAGRRRAPAARFGSSESSSASDSQPDVGSDAPAASSDDDGQMPRFRSDASSESEGEEGKEEEGSPRGSGGQPSGGKKRRVGGGREEARRASLCQALQSDSDGEPLQTARAARRAAGPAGPSRMVSDEENDRSAANVDTGAAAHVKHGKKQAEAGQSSGEDAPRRRKGSNGGKGAGKLSAAQASALAAIAARRAARDTQQDADQEEEAAAAAVQQKRRKLVKRAGADEAMQQGDLLEDF